MNELLDRAKLRSKYVDSLTAKLIGELIGEVSHLRNELERVRKQATGYSESVKQHELIAEENKRYKTKERSVSAKNTRYKHIIKELLDYIGPVDNAILKNIRKRLKGIEEDV